MTAEVIAALYARVAAAVSRDSDSEVPPLTVAYWLAEIRRMCSSGRR